MKITAAIIALFSVHFFSVGQRVSQQPNIVFILTDDMGYTDLGCYGNPFNETPHIDSLAKSGLRFTQAYAASPVCSPSRASFMTGKHPARHKITNFLVGDRRDSTSAYDPAPWQERGLDGSEVTIAERLQAIDYNTGVIGKWHLGWGDGQHAWQQGFDFSRIITKNGLDYYNYEIDEHDIGSTFKDDGTNYLTDKLTNYATEFIEKQKVDNPFFLFLSYSAPHVLTVPRGDKLAKYFWKYEKFGGKYNPNYAAMIESVDDGVGAIIKLLKARGLDKNTIVIFTSDNGGVGLAELGPIPTTIDGLKKWKGFVYEGGIKVPLIISHPSKIPANLKNENIISNTDFFNTFLELTGQKPEVDLDSKSFNNILNNPTEQFDRGDYLWHYPHFSNQMSRPAGSLRLGDWKIVRSYETQKVKLYNLKTDEAETTDLSTLHPKKTTELNDLLSKRLADYQANMPVLKNY